MAVKPAIVTLTNSSVDILNAIRNNASVNYRNYVPVATDKAESLRSIGTVIMDNPQLQNEFINALSNRIGKVVLTSKMFSNPWAIFKKGMLEFGETIEEIFVNIAKPYNYDAEVAENNVFKREKADIKSAFHVMNYQKFYKVTIQQNDLRKAFLSWAGITDLIAKIVDSMYSAAEYDEYQTMKYMLAKNIINGRLKPVSIGEITATNMKSAVAKIKSVSNNMTFLSSDYNMSGVKTKCDKTEQYVILDTAFDATVDVEVLASAFNMSKAEFIGHRLIVDGFGNIDNERLAELFKGDETYEAITEEELDMLKGIPAIIATSDFFMIFDNLFDMTEQFNGEGIYWNYWYHTWKTFSISPFANAALFVKGTPSVTSVTVTPSSASAAVGSTIALGVDVVTENFAPKTVKWTSSSDKVSVSASGVVKILSGATGTITITATSTVDNTKKSVCSITVA